VQKELFSFRSLEFSTEDISACDTKIAWDGGISI